MPKGPLSVGISGVRISIFECGKRVGTRTFVNSPNRQVVSGLRNGVTYNFGVQALNKYGAGPLVYSNPVAPAVPGTTPGRVSALHAAPGVAALAVSWRAPVTRGTSPITGYRVSSYVIGHCVSTKTISRTSQTAVVRGLDPKLTYRVSVQAINASGDAPVVQSNAVRPIAPRAPGPVAAIWVSGRDRGARVSWTPPRDPGNSPIDGYRVSAFNCGKVAKEESFNSTATTENVTGLTNGVSYTLGVTATNAAGAGRQAVSPVVTPTGPGLPGPVSAVSASADHGRALVAWHAPANGGSAITAYRISIVTDGACVAWQRFHSPATSAVVTGLTNGQAYTFAVKAVNAAGEGSAVMSNAVVPTSPFTLYTDPSVETTRGITAGPDGALWSTESGPEAIGRITTTGTITHFTDPSISEPTRITAGPDGALWFTNYGNNSIGRITTTGSVTHYTDPSIAGPMGITAGPDGALWFTNSGHGFSGSIGRISTTGTVTHYTDPGINYPLSIAPGPDGALWFTNYYNNSIGRITTTGTVSLYFNPGITYPVSIAPGPDGALWFTNYNSIGRITTTGTVSLYTDPGIKFPVSIAPGPDGAMWFIENGNTLGRLTTTGALTFYPDAGDLRDIAEGPDHALWFTSEDGIVRMTMPPYVNAAPTSGTRGTAITVNGGGFHAGETVTVDYNTELAAPSKVQICQTTADANGVFQCSGNIPSSNAGPPGDHAITADGITKLSHDTVTFTLN
jgi:virginiamycin B lyase